MSRLQKSLLIFFAMLLPYGIYVLPVLVENGGGKCLSEELREEQHHDYVWGLLSFIKRKHTALCGIPPPVKDYGNQTYVEFIPGGTAPKPVPLPGEWQVSHTIVKTSYWAVRLDYFAYTNRYNYHTRIGWRWDDLDHYYVPSVVPVKKIGYNWARIIWLWERRFEYRNCG